MTRPEAISLPGAALPGVENSQVLYKTPGVAPKWLTGGDGVWLTDRTGARYLDTCGGVGVSSLGHRHPRIVEAIRREADHLSWAHAGSFTTAPAEELASLLVAQSQGLGQAQFLSGGSEAVELALKIAYQYHYETGEPGRTTVVARRQNYHGSTLATLAISGNRQRRSIFEPLLGRAEFVSPCYAYRDVRSGETEDAYAARLAAELDETIRRAGPATVGAFVAETVVGSTSGAVPAVPGYFAKVQEVCRRHGILLILDEVMAGLGRTGLPFAYLEDGIVPDLAVVGKGLAAGYQPISAVLVSDAIHDALKHGSGVLRNGQTQVNHPLACAIALEVQRTIHDEGLLDNVLDRGRQLRTMLTEGLQFSDIVGDIRGRGLFVGVEFVADRATGRPFNGGEEFVRQIKREAFERGLLIYPGYGTVDGVQGNHVLFAPPFICTESIVSELVGRFVEVVRAVEARRNP